MEKLWFSIYDFSFDYKGSEPSFIDPAPFDWAQELKQNVHIIKGELEHYLQQNQLQSYFNTSMVAKQNSWRTIALKTWSIQLFKHQKKFPITTQLLNKYPQIVSASFNLLEPESKILRHCGDTNAIYRCHLGLEIPEGLPKTGFNVRDETRPWKEGEWLIFMDAYQHEAFNNSSKPRFIFLLDVMRPEFMDRKKKVCSTVLTSLFLQKRAEKYKFLLSSKPLFITTLARFLQPFSRMAIALVNLFKVY